MQSARMVFHKPRPSLNTSSANRLRKSANAMHKILGDQNNSRPTGLSVEISPFLLE
jgi:hypothetical protein